MSILTPCRAVTTRPLWNRLPHHHNPRTANAIAKDTIEEKVLALANRKGELFRGVMNDGNAFGAALNADDIRTLIA
jgi:hypothetical protein